MKRILSKNYLWLLFIFAISLVVYLFTLCPTVYLEDSGELIAAVDSLGIPHPSGYPLYVMLGKLFTLIIPLGSVAWKVNFMSAFFGALTCAILFLIIQKTFKHLNKRTFKQENNETMKLYSDEATEQQNSRNFVLYYLIPFISSLIFAFTGIFWSQNVIAEVYTLNSFFVVLIIYCLLAWSAKEKDHKLNQDKKLKSKSEILFLFIALFLGMSLANHQMMVLLIPVFAIFILLNNWRIILNYKLILAAAFLFSLGLSIYFFLPIRAVANPAMNWSDPQNITNFIEHVTRTQYNDFSSNLLGNLQETNHLLLINSFFNDILDNFTWLGCCLAVLGFIYLWFKRKSIFVLTFGSFLFNSIIILILRQTSGSYLNEVIYRVYYIPSFIATIIWLALGLFLLIKLFIIVADKLKNELLKKMFLAVLIIVMLTLPVSFLISNYNSNNLSNFWLADDWSRKVLESLEPDAQIIAFNDQPALDSQVFSLMYQQVVNNLRRDVKIINVAGIRGIFHAAGGQVFEDFFDYDQGEQKNKLVEIIVENTEIERPTYILYPLGQNEDADYVTRSNGFTYRVYDNLKQAKQDEEQYESLETGGIRSVLYPVLENNIYYRDFISEIYYAESSYYLEMAQLELAEKNFRKGLKYDIDPISLNSKAYIQHRALWLE